MSNSRRKKLTNRKRRIAYRLRDRNRATQADRGPDVTPDAVKDESE